MTTKSKLAIIPAGYKVVPEEPTIEQLRAAAMLRSPGSRMFKNSEMYRALIDSAPHLDTPPVLRWEGDEHEKSLIVGIRIIALVWSVDMHWVSSACIVSGRYTKFPTEQEARRAAEKALGFPDDLAVEVV